MDIFGTTEKALRARITVLTEKNNELQATIETQRSEAIMLSTRIAEIAAINTRLNDENMMFRARAQEMDLSPIIDRIDETHKVLDTSINSMKEELKAEVIKSRKTTQPTEASVIQPKPTEYIPPTEPSLKKKNGLAAYHERRRKEKEEARLKEESKGE